MEIKGTYQYPKIYALGSAEVAGILNGPVEVTEKVDGSQIGFGIVDGELIIRSKGSLLNQEQPTGLFRDAVAYIRTIKDKLKPGWFYYGECLQSPRHNKLKYGRVPHHNIALYGMRFGDEFYEIEQKLKAKGIEPKRITHLPAEAQFAQIINVTDYDMQDDIGEYESRPSRNRRTNAAPATLHREG